MKHTFLKLVAIAFCSCGLAHAQGIGGQPLTGGGGGGGATFPATNGLVCNTSTTASQTCTQAQVNAFLTSPGTIGSVAPGSGAFTTLTTTGTANIGGVLFVDQINARSVAGGMGQFNLNGNVLTRSLADGAPTVIVNDSTGTNAGPIASFRRANTQVSQILPGGGYSGPQVVTPPETVTFSATPTLSASTEISRIILTGNVTSSTLAAGSDGAHKTIILCQDATGSRTFVPPTNVFGFGTIGTTLSKCNTQSFVYSTLAGYVGWYASGAMIMNE